MSTRVRRVDEYKVNNSYLNLCQQHYLKIYFIPLPLLLPKAMVLYIYNAFVSTFRIYPLKMIK